MKTLLILSILIMSLGGYTAYAEEAVIQVPFEFLEEDTSVTFFEFDEFYQLLVKITGAKDIQPLVVERDPVSDYLPFCTDINLVYDVQTDSCITTQQLEKEAIDNYIAAPIKEERKTGMELRIIYLENKTNPTSDDMSELTLLTQAGALCSNDTLVSQTYRSFDVATEEYLDLEGNWKSQLVQDFTPTTGTFRDSPYEKHLKLGIAECIAQPYTKKSVQYDHMAVDNEYTIPVTHQTKAEGVIERSQEYINRIANDPKLTSEFFNSACKTYPERSRVMFGCESKYEIDPTAHGNTVSVDSKYIYTSAYQNWLEYKEDPNIDLDEYKNKIVIRKSTVYGGGYP